jgi:hypothetical protein
VSPYQYKNKRWRQLSRRPALSILKMEAMRKLQWVFFLQYKFMSVLEHTRVPLEVIFEVKGQAIKIG